MFVTAVAATHIFGPLNYALYPVVFLGGIGGTLLGFGIIPSGAPDQGQEAALEKNLRRLRWLGPLIMAMAVVAFVLQITGVL